MKIQEMPISYNRQAFADHAAETDRQHRLRQKPDTAKGSAPASLTVTLSNTSKNLLTARSAALQAPDERPDKIAALRETIENGSYRIDPDKIAEKMIGR